VYTAVHAFVTVDFDELAAQPRVDLLGLLHHALADQDPFTHDQSLLHEDLLFEHRD
jgi:hypothetical protein